MVVLMELIPLQDPSLGSIANYGAWSRLLFASFFLAVGFIVQTKELLPALRMSPVNVISIASLTSSAIVLSMMGFCSVWVYPIPLGAVVAAPPFFIFLLLSSYVTVGRQRLHDNPSLIHDLKRQLDVLNAQGVCAILYVTFSAIYYQLAKNQQTAFVLVLPLLKWAVEQVIARTTNHIEEYLAGIVVFSVEIFNALYVAKCLQNGGSRITFVVLISIDLIKMAITFHSMHRETTEISRMISNELMLSEDHNTSVLEMVLRACQRRGVLSAIEGEPIIRVRSSLEMTLSAGTANLVDLIERLNSDSAAQTQHLIRQLPIDNPSIKPITTYNSSVSRIWPNAVDNKVSSCEATKGNEAQPSATTTAYIANSSSQQRFVHRSLKVLFQYEYHALVEYVEFMIPLAYALYITILCQLPSVVYYPETKRLTELQRRHMVENIFIYALLEFLSFVLLHLMVKRSFKFSLLHLLAFTIKNRFAEFQGRLLAAFAYVMPITLVRFGTVANMLIRGMLPFTTDVLWILHS